jgi:hypothetical protein
MGARVAFCFLRALFVERAEVVLVGERDEVRGRFGLIVSNDALCESGPRLPQSPAFFLGGACFDHLQACAMCPALSF